MRIAGLRWWTIALIMVGAILNFLTRSTLSVAAPTVLTDLHIGEKEYSWVLLAFQLTIMLQPVVGLLLDVVGLRIGMAVVAVVWSVVNMAHGLAHSWQMLAGLRGALGFAEGSANPGGMKVVSEWFPAKERGLAGGIYNIGASLGSMAAPPLVAWAILTYNWRTAFVITGAMGLIWAFVWLLFYRPPDRHPALTDMERKYILAGQEKHLGHAGTLPSILEILRRRNFWGIALPRLFADPTWAALTFWLPLYFTKVHHFDLKQIALYGWMPFLAADLGSMFGPVVVLALQKLGVGLIDARRGAFSLGTVMMVGVAFTGFVASPYAAIALLCLAAFAHQTLSVTVITMSSDLFRRSEVATVAGMAGTFGNAGVLAFNTLVGALVLLIGYWPFFVALAVLDIVGAIVLWSFVRESHAR